MSKPSSRSKQSLITDAKSIETALTRGVAEVLPSREGLTKLMAARPITLYLGIDPTGSLLTLGHAVVLRKLQQFADLGHHVILLIGNGTVKIGDPTGRDSTRPMLTDEQINENFKNWQAQASKVLDFSKIEIRHNGDWLDKLTMPQIIKLAAQTTVQQLIERDMFQDRMKKGLPIFGHEILYPLLQGYDSVAMNVDLEIGGTDQTFNMMVGRQLQKTYNNHEKWVLSTPIINGTDGRKMSKSYGNFIAITETPNDMYGKLMSIADEMIIEYFLVLTDVAMDEIDAMSAAMKSGKNPMEFKKKLAHTITTWLHTAQAADAAAKHFEDTIQNKTISESVPEVALSLSKSDAPTFGEVVKLAQPALSNSGIQRLIKEGAVEALPANVKPQSIQDAWPMGETHLRIGKRFYKIV